MDFGSLAIVIAAGLLGPLLASSHRVAPPVVIGQIAAGVIVGRSGFHWVDPSEPFLGGLATLGFALLMFVVGTHLPVRDARLRVALANGVGATLTVVVLAGAAGFGLSFVVGLHRPAVLATLLATSSGAVALPVLQSLGRDDRALLDTTAWIAIADVVTVLAVPVVLATGATWRVVSGGLLVVATGALLYLVALALRGWSRVRRGQELSRERGWGLELRISFVALFTAAWVATRFGTSILLAGFTVGAVVALLGEPRRVAIQLIGVGEGFLIPVYFVHLGAQLDLGALARSPRSMWLATALAVTALVVHVVAATVWRLPVAAGLLATAQLGVPAAITSIGLSTGQLTPAQGAAVMAAVLVTLAACAVGGVRLGHTGTLTDASAPQIRRWLVARLHRGSP